MTLKHIFTLIFFGFASVTSLIVGKVVDSAKTLPVHNRVGKAHPIKAAHQHYNMKRKLALK